MHAFRRGVAGGSEGEQLVAERVAAAAARVHEENVNKNNVG